MHYVTNSTSLDAKRSSLFKNIKMGTTTSICPVICFVFFCIFNGISSKEEKRANKDTVIMVSLDGMGWQPGGGGGTPIHYLCGYVPPSGVVILKLLI